MMNLRGSYLVGFNFSYGPKDEEDEIGINPSY